MLYDETDWRAPQREWSQFVLVCQRGVSGQVSESLWLWQTALHFVEQHQICHAETVPRARRNVTLNERENHTWKDQWNAGHHPFEHKVSYPFYKLIFIDWTYGPCRPRQHVSSSDLQWSFHVVNVVSYTNQEIICQTQIKSYQRVLLMTSQ